MWPNPKSPADLVTFTEEFLNGKFLFFVQWMFLQKSTIIDAWQVFKYTSGFNKFSSMKSEALKNYTLSKTFSSIESNFYAELSQQ